MKSTPLFVLFALFYPEIRDNRQMIGGPAAEFPGFNPAFVINQAFPGVEKDMINRLIHTRVGGDIISWGQPDEAVIGFQQADNAKLIPGGIEISGQDQRFISFKDVVFYQVQKLTHLLVTHQMGFLDRVLFDLWLAFSDQGGQVQGGNEGVRRFFEPGQQCIPRLSVPVAFISGRLVKRDIARDAGVVWLP